MVKVKITGRTRDLLHDEDEWIFDVRISMEQPDYLSLTYDAKTKEWPAMRSSLAGNLMQAITTWLRNNKADKNG
jgi:hypothetical protein